MKIKHPRRDCLYLSGSMEYNNKCDIWRDKMYLALRHKFHVIRPWNANIRYGKGSPEYSKFVYHNLVMPDLSDVSRSRFFFIKIDPAVFKGAGTISELSLAAFYNRQILAFIDGVKKEEMPGWMLGCLARANFATSIDQAIEYYKNLKIEGDEV